MLVAVDKLSNLPPCADYGIDFKGKKDKHSLLLFVSDFRITRPFKIHFLGPSGGS
jgi:hypothetical protein